MYKHILILPEGQEISSGPGTVHAIRSLTLTQSVNAEKDLMIGSCCSDMLEATLFTPGGLPITAGTEVTLYKERLGHRVKLGTFTVENPTRPSPNITRLTGFDAMKKLEKDLTAWLDTLTGWPYSLQEFADMVCAACDVTYVQRPVPNEDFPIEQWSQQGATGRKIMGWLGEIACRYVHADPHGSIGFGWYLDSGKTLSPTGENYYSALSYEDYTVAPVDTVQMRLGVGENGAPWPPAKDWENAYILPRNPIYCARVTEKLQHYLDTALCEFQDLTEYTPCTVTAPADPSVGPGSILRVQTPRGVITALVMEKISTARQDTYICTGNPRRTAPQDETAQALTQENIFQALTRGDLDQGIYLENGKVYINAQYLKTGTFQATGEIFLEPGFPEAEAIKNHIMGVMPLTEPEKYDFNGDGEVTVTDMLMAQKCALGLLSLAHWAGAVKTPVTVTLDPANAERVISIRGTNMWGREEERYLGLSGADMGRLLGDLTLTGKVLLGEATVVDALPAASQPGQLIFVKAPTDTPWAPCQCYIGV